MRALLLILAVLVSTATVAQDDSGPATSADVALHAIEGYIRPSFDRFEEQAQQLEFALADLCATASATSLDEARGRFGTTVAGFARISFLRFGPLVRENRIERLWLWPDPRGIALKQVQAVLAEEPADLLEADALQEKSVALQGFNALEFVLFGTGAEELAATSATYRCRYGSAIAVAVRRIAEEMAMEWRAADDISARLIAPSAADADYRTVREVLEEFVGSAAHGIEAIRDTQLLPFIGRTRFDPKPRSAAFWRSGQTFEVMRAGFDGLESFIAQSRVVEAAGGDTRWLDSSLSFDFEQMRDAFSRVAPPVDAALADPAQVRALDEVLALTRDLQGLVGDALAKLLGLSVGFSSLDGD